ncbi:MAG: hypothetical protein IPM54_05705 [Polyangiaceae bacterium]|nr:hypothetical protein [Polyangiaceae bacterium]
MRSVAIVAPISLALIVTLPCCNRCSSSTVDAPDASEVEPPEVVEVDVLPPPAAWKFEPVRLGPTFLGPALPPGCSMREPLVRAKVRASTRFVAASSALGSLVIADADTAETPPRLTGVAAFELDPAGTSSKPFAVPWTEATAMPRLARTNTGAWIAAYSEPTADKLSKVFVFQNNAATSIGEGESFDAIDSSCNGDVCVLLTTRLAKVSAPGADVWMGKPNESVTSWRRHEIVPQAGDSDARPSCIARLDVVATDADAGGRSEPVVGLFEASDLVFWGVGSADKPRELGRVPAPHGIVDATVLGRPVALVYGAPVDDDGCAKQGGIMRFSRLGAPDVDVRAPAPATSGALRPLARGGLATYIAPIECRAARKVVYAVVLGEDGAPTSAPMPVGDASSFAVTTQGDNVDLWIQRDDDVVWIRATCAAP